MPGLNKKGPLGQGSLTGGQRGICLPNNETLSPGENETLQQPAGGIRGGAGCRRRGGAGRGAGQGAGMGRKTSR
ncbi:MAG: hypothetical protein KKD01_06830 [Proteobacteria bacterium]|nr:hypothetical protein [Pseudomonadota bacterium]MBU1137395.1 hypothetical protein [Pseudomonadota bacterium]MBU1233007.1 hypothetical protein [Pseudomonadota bacterium]MBU1418681.1 hypothetical protein [Pseudomonadota bacterium]MBU1454427.1 hypothetical protein [Pseudomonadota bacterium]